MWAQQSAAKLLDHASVDFLQGTFQMPKSFVEFPLSYQDDQRPTLPAHRRTITNSNLKENKPIVVSLSKKTKNSRMKTLTQYKQEQNHYDHV